MELTAEVVAKVENSNGFMIHITISKEDQPIEGQGGGILAALKVNENEFNRLEIGDVITFKEVGN